jgi:hypothetical protein
VGESVAGGDSLETLRQKVNAHITSLSDHETMGLARSDTLTAHLTGDPAHTAAQISVTQAYDDLQAAITALFAASGSGTATTADAVTVQDTGSYFAGGHVEAVLQEIGADLAVGTHNLDSHSDVDLTSIAPATGDVLRWNGTNWVSTPNIYHPSAHFAETVAVGTIPGRSIIQEDVFHFRRVQAQVTTPSSSGAITVEIRYGDGATNTSTSVGTITIAQGAYRAVDLGIAASNIMLDSGDFIVANVTAAGTGAANLTLAYRGYVL